MRQFSFKIFEDEDPDLITWLDSLGRREKSIEIRRALRAYCRGRLAEPVPVGSALPRPAPEVPALLHEADDSVLDRVVEAETVPDKNEVSRRNLERLKEMF